MSVVTAQTFARAFLGKDYGFGEFAGGTHRPFRQGGDGKRVPTFSREVFWGSVSNAEESMGKRAGDFNIACSRGTVTATITLLTAFIGLLIERVCKCISSRQKEEDVTQAVVDLHGKILNDEIQDEGLGHRSVSVMLKHGGELKVSENTNGDGTVLTITVETGATSESFAIEGCTFDDFRAVLEQEIVRHEADHYLYGQTVANIPLERQQLLRGGKNKQGIDLRKADLRGMNLSRLNLRQANLSGMDLRGAILGGVNLSAAKLDGANLSEANLSGANLSGANLSGANLSGANLSGANLSGAKLSGAALSGANLGGANLSWMRLSGMDLSRANLSGANLTGADLSWADLSGANLSGANLSGADLRRTKLSGVTVQQTTFSLDALLDAEGFTDEMFSGIVFAGLIEDLGSAVARDVYFNHRNNPDSGSILTAIDTRLKGDNKLRCMELAIRALDDAMNAGVKDPEVDAVVTEFLFAHPEYQQSDVIQSFVQKAVGRLFLSAQDVPLTLEGWSSHGLGFMLDHAQTQLAQPAPRGYAWARANSFGLLQILDAAEQHEELRAKATALRQAYLDALPASLIQFVTESAKNMYAPALSYFPLLARDEEVCILLTTEDYRKGMRAPGDPGEDLGSVFVAVDWSGKGGAGTPPYTEAHLARFPVLHARSIARLSSQAFGNIVKCLLPPAYVERYLLGASNGAKQNWTTPQIQADLKRFIMPLMGHERDDAVRFDTLSDARVSEETLKQLLKEAEAVHGPMNNTEKAFFLRSQAAALSYASSTRLFGQEVDSPEALRALAAAMLNNADDLDPGTERFSKDGLANLKKRLLGEGETFTCSAVVSGLLRDELRNQMKNNERLEKIYNATYPVRWG
ncbi:pentapeptide repeat-containing protein, partial [Paraburkholderia sp. RL17-373-BIF-A]|uniref:pentapeptide repeat-containing protein n=1 Tax=Paraburkholderia sp. RL17-373-BIF-A TaxID=3031629 RepID=UPI0038B85D90